MVEAGLQEFETHFSSLQNTFTQLIATRPIMDLCLAAERRPGSRVYNWLWEKEGMDLYGMRTAD